MSDRIERAVSLRAFEKQTFETFEFSEAWREHLGAPQKTGNWFLWGNSGNGKTSYILQLIKEFTNHERIIYNSLEEGSRMSMQLAMKKFGLFSRSKSIVYVQSDLENLKKRLRQRRSPRIVIIDSIQYLDIDKFGYLSYRQEFADTVLTIWTSHADGTRPAGRTAEFVRYDSDVKINVDQYRATSVSRGFTTEPFDIWPEKAKELHGH